MAAAEFNPRSKASIRQLLNETLILTTLLLLVTHLLTMAQGREICLVPSPKGYCGSQSAGLALAKELCELLTCRSIRNIHANDVRDGAAEVSRGNTVIEGRWWKK